MLRVASDGVVDGMLVVMGVGLWWVLTVVLVGQQVSMATLCSGVGVVCVELVGCKSEVDVLTVGEPYGVGWVCVVVYDERSVRVE